MSGVKALAGKLGNLARAGELEIATTAAGKMWTRALAKVHVRTGETQAEMGFFGHRDGVVVTGPRSMYFEPTRTAWRSGVRDSIREAVHEGIGKAMS